MQFQCGTEHMCDDANRHAPRCFSPSGIRGAVFWRGAWGGAWEGSGGLEEKQKPQVAHSSIVHPLILQLIKELSSSSERFSN
jgi:hypothetical protein